MLCEFLLFLKSILQQRKCKINYLCTQNKNKNENVFVNVSVWLNLPDKKFKMCKQSAAHTTPQLFIGSLKEAKQKINVCMYVFNLL